jgi:hypothetical protein
MTNYLNEMPEQVRHDKKARVVIPAMAGIQKTSVSENYKKNYDSHTALDAVSIF